MRRYLNLRQLAAALGKQPGWLYRNMRRLQRDHGFPKRDEAMRAWDAGAVAAWQDRRLGLDITVGLMLPGLADEDLVDIGAELDRRAAEIFDAA